MVSSHGHSHKLLQLREAETEATEATTQSHESVFTQAPDVQKWWDAWWIAELDHVQICFILLLMQEDRKRIQKKCPSVPDRPLWDRCDIQAVVVSYWAQLSWWMITSPSLVLLLQERLGQSVINGCSTRCAQNFYITLSPRSLIHFSQQPTGRLTPAY